MRFERGKSVKESLELGAMAKLEKYGAEILQRYQFELHTERGIKEVQAVLERLLGFPVEVEYTPATENSAAEFKVQIKP